LGIAGATRSLPRSVRPDGPARSCIEVIEVVKDSPADKAGIRVGDLITELDGQPMTGVSDLLKLLQHEVIASPLTVTLLRDGNERRRQVTPVELQ
ncbi:MAG: PDZ domain-containing protein, partial [Acidobacteriota bacterium]|nr:PDZ domain-containing protein [Acidobacteriota bacterium]